MNEHLIYAHPILAIHLTDLFKSIAEHGYVPGGFSDGRSDNEDKLGGKNYVNNYSGITPIALISELFE